MKDKTVYFRDGVVMTESGKTRVYQMDKELYLEVGPGHNLISSSDDIADYIWQINDKPFGNCLIIGLGLGISAEYVLSIPRVNSLTVIEENLDVIKVQEVINKIDNKKLSIINKEILPYLYQTKDTFDFIFIDCYTHIDEDTLPFIADVIAGAKRVLKVNGSLSGWLDDNTPEIFIKYFFKLFD